MQFAQEKNEQLRWYHEPRLVTYVGSSNFREKGSEKLTSSLTITQPGTYVLTDDIVTATDAQSLITIASSNVTLDFNTRTITHENHNQKINGVTVQDGLSNITIKNGRIFKIGGIGLAIENRCSQVTVSNCIFDQLSQGGITVKEGCSDLILEGCTVANSTAKANDLVGIQIVNVQGIVLQNCHVSHLATGSSYSLRGVSIEAASCVLIDHLTCQHLSGKRVIGLFCTQVGDCVVKAYTACRCKSFLKETYGILWKGVHASSIEQCVITQLTGHTNCFGIFFDHCFSNTLSKSAVITIKSESNGNVSGIILGQGAHNRIEHCTSSGHTAGSTPHSRSAGICLHNEACSTITDSSTQSNDGGQGSGYGILLKAVDRCIITQNKCHCNTGKKGGWGIYEGEPSTSFIARNWAFANKSNNYDVKVTKGRFPSVEKKVHQIDKLPDTTSMNNISVVLEEKEHEWPNFDKEDDDD